MFLVFFFGELLTQEYLLLFELLGIIASPQLMLFQCCFVLNLMSRKLIHSQGHYLCGMCTFPPCLGGFSPDIPKIFMLGVLA